jgi:hypothetical protein
MARKLAKKYSRRYGEAYSPSLRREGLRGTPVARRPSAGRVSCDR